MNANRFAFIGVHSRLSRLRIARLAYMPAWAAAVSNSAFFGMGGMGLASRQGELQAVLAEPLRIDLAEKSLHLPADGIVSTSLLDSLLLPRPGKSSSELVSVMI